MLLGLSLGGMAATLALTLGVFNPPAAGASSVRHARVPSAVLPDGGPARMADGGVETIEVIEQMIPSPHFEGY